MKLGQSDPRNRVKTERTDRAVSPVIGVILMVAITVILAAVIGVFVLGLGDELGDNQPTATVGIDADDIDFDEIAAPDNTFDDLAEGEATIEVSHSSGADLDADEFSLILRDTENNNVYELEGEDDLWDGSLSTGDTFTFDLEDATDIDGALDSDDDANGTWEVQLVHNPSSSIQTDAAFEVENYDTG